jgi:hypothetical protein
MPTQPNRQGGPSSVISAGYKLEPENDRLESLSDAAKIQEGQDD